MRAIIFIIFVFVTRTAPQVCRQENSVELTNRSYNGIKYEDSEYFVDNKTGIERGCVCLKEICARKCCPFGKGYDENKRTCVDLSVKFDPLVWEGSQVKSGFNASKEFHFFLSKMRCSKEKNEFRIIVRDFTHDYHLRSDGKLSVTMENDIPPNIIYDPDKYCIDNFLDENNEVRLNALICFAPKEEDNHYGLSASCMLISCFFILLTVAVYAFLPELRTLHGMVMTAYLLSFFVGFLFMATMQILLLVDNITQIWCTSMSFVIYFSLLAAFFWLNVMCYDLWSKFRTISVMNSLTTTVRTRFLVYCAYAFGGPAVLTVLLAALEFSDLPETIKYLPHLRRQGCFLSGTSKLLYLYVPILVLCVTNLVFFILTAKRIAEIKKQTDMLQRKDTQRFSLYIKLFIVTGLNWIFEVISSFFPEIDYLWQFTDAYNVLVGLIIFIIFICKKKTLKSIKRRYQELKGKPLSRTDTNPSTSMSLSQSQEDIQMKSHLPHS